MNIKIEHLRLSRNGGFIVPCVVKNISGRVREVFASDDGWQKIVLRGSINK
jgi:hypothetical protein